MHFSTVFRYLFLCVLICSVSDLTHIDCMFQSSLAFRIGSELCFVSYRAVWGIAFSATSLCALKVCGDQFMSARFEMPLADVLLNKREIKQKDSNKWSSEVLFVSILGHSIE